MNAPPETWNAYADEVRLFLTEDARRQGLEGFIERHILYATREIVAAVPGFQRPTRLVVPQDDWSEEGKTSLGSLDNRINPDDGLRVYLFGEDEAESGALLNGYVLTQTSWNMWLAMVNGSYWRKDVYAFGPNREFMIYPVIPAGKTIVLYGYFLPDFLDWQANGVVPFGAAALAASFKVKAEIASSVDNDSAMANREMGKYFRELRKMKSTYGRRT